MQRVGEPAFRAPKFNCPHCGAYSGQRWQPQTLHEAPGVVPTLWSARCDACENYTFWLRERLIYPSSLTGPVPTRDMSEDIRKVYEEARTIAAASPRAAAALLRVCVEMVVNELVPGPGRLNTKIGTLVERDLDPNIQKMLDSVRVYGNDGGAHPGEIDLKEQPEVVPMLMFCVNRIVEQMVTWPRQVTALYETLPESKREGIEQRDRNSTKSN